MRVTLALLLLTSCTPKPYIKVEEICDGESFRRVCVESIQFYSDKEFTKPTKKIPLYDIDEAKKEIKEIIGEKLAENNYELVPCSEKTHILHAKLDFAIFFGFFQPYVQYRARLFQNKQELFKVTGIEVSASLKKEDIKATPKRLADKLMKTFIDKAKAYEELKNRHF